MPKFYLLDFLYFTNIEIFKSVRFRTLTVR